MKKPSGEWCFEVTDVTHTNYTYDPGANIVTYACESGPVYKLIGEQLPTEFALAQNYPNPFNSSTEIVFELPEPAYVTIDIYNISGQRIAVLVDGFMSAGRHYTIWNADRVPSGMYLYRMRSGNFNSTMKMSLIK
jgi:hypothetical protein